MKWSIVAALAAVWAALMLSEPLTRGQETLRSGICLGYLGLVIAAFAFARWRRIW